VEGGWRKEIGTPSPRSLTMMLSHDAGPSVGSAGAKESWVSQVSVFSMPAWMREAS